MKNTVIRSLAYKVASRYLGFNKEEESLPWLEYLKKKNTPRERPSQNTLNEFSKAVVDTSPANADGQLGKSLLDGVQDGRSRSREQEYQPANENDNLGPGKGGLFPVEFTKPNRSEMPDNSRWMTWQNRHRQDDATGNPWGSNLYGPYNTIEASQPPSKKVAKTIKEVMDNSSHERSRDILESAKSLTVQDASKKDEKEKGRYVLKVTGGSDAQEVTVQFLKAQGKSSLAEHPCLIACSCEDFLWGGPQFYAVKGKYMYMPKFRPQLMEPRSKENGGRGKGLTACKHIAAVSTKLSDFLPDEEAYTEDIQNKLLSVKDDAFKDISTLPKEEITEEYQLDRKTDFVQFLEDSRLHGDVLKQGRKSLKDRGVSEYALYDYVQGTFAELRKGVQEKVLERLEDSPSTIVLLLVEYKKAFGKIPKYLSDVAYAVIKDKIS